MLKRVKIQGYKSLVDVEIELQPLTVLFGPNASGKSNFLDALQLLSRIATERTLNNAFSPPYRGTPLESFAFGATGVQGLRRQEKLSFSIEIDVELSASVINAVTLMRKVDLFVEDFGHEIFLSTLLQRLAAHHSISIEINFGSARGGYGTTIKELKKYIWNEPVTL